MEAPPNVCTPTHLAQAAAEIAESASEVMTLEVLEKEECEKLGMELYLAVAACSEEPPKFIHLTYKPKGVLMLQLGPVPPKCIHPTSKTRGVADLQADTTLGPIRLPASPKGLC